MKVVHKSAEGEAARPLLRDSESGMNAGAHECAGVANGVRTSQDQAKETCNPMIRKNEASETEETSNESRAIPSASVDTSTRKTSKWFAISCDKHALNSKKAALKQVEWRTQRSKVCSCSALKRKLLAMLVVLALFALYVNSYLLRGEDDGHIPVLHYSHVPGMKGYLVWSERCKMPSIDPYLPEVMEFFERQEYEICSTQQPLTRVQFVTQTHRYMLVIIKEAVPSYAKSGSLECCYQAIERSGVGKSADNDVSLSKCVPFRNGTQLTPAIDNILVKCKSKNKQVYINGHPLMPAREEIRRRLHTWRARSNATSVLMIGIDSISRVNLIRAMPKTAQYLYDNEWFEMSGYNKIDDNTFPNLMAILTGRNKANAFKKCPPTVVHGLDDCSFIWKTFREHGYVTAYAEDEASINTFNYLKLGFERPPVDYYLRPFLLSAEKHLPIKRKSNLAQCLGYQNSADYVYNYALEMATRYRHEPYFGLFWTNTFSHNAISDCSAMDAHMVAYLRKFATLGTLDNAIVIFLSDHGLRFGPTRKTLSGHLEERLPFMFIWLPPHLKHSHPEFVNALSVNKNRLTNPYDLHMTLKHVLELSGRVTDAQKLASAEDCARCQTLLAPVPHNRSCDDIAIEEHWCTCIPFQSVYKDSKTVLKMAHGIVKYINEFVSQFRNGSFVKFCRTLHLGSVESAYRAQTNELSWRQHDKSLEVYRINFSTKPNHALFEATVRYYAARGDFEVTGEISRLDGYAKDSQCVSDGAAKKYCSCRRKLWW